MRIIIKKASISSNDAKMGKYYIESAIFWKDQAEFCREFGDVGNAIRFACQAESRLQKARTYLGFATVKDMIWWYKKKYNIEL